MANQVVEINHIVAVPAPANDVIEVCSEIPTSMKQLEPISA